VLFLDEPTAGMNPEELVQMMEIIRRVHAEFDLAIYLIEHRLKMVMELCEVIQTLVSARSSPRDPRRRSRTTPWSSRPTWARRGGVSHA
jgi:branched-chain amino acid transport system ATP-binding protein